MNTSNEELGKVIRAEYEMQEMLERELRAEHTHEMREREQELKILEKELGE